MVRILFQDQPIIKAKPKYFPDDDLDIGDEIDDEEMLDGKSKS